MTQEEIEAVAQQISDMGTGINLEYFLGALGIVVVAVLRQYPPEERMAAAMSWVAVLSNQMLQDWNRAKAN